MLDRDAIQRLIPHAGAMCLLDGVDRWTAETIVAIARSHLEPDNPLRARDRLPLIAGAEYACQAMALHGALVAGGLAQRPGRVAALRLDRMTADRLDDAAFGSLAVEATCRFGDPAGMLYRFVVRASAIDRILLEGSATIALTPALGAIPVR